jgi:hypothetical protein
MKIWITLGLAVGTAIPGGLCFAQPKEADLLPQGEAEVAFAFKDAYRLFKGECPDGTLGDKAQALVSDKLDAQNPKNKDIHADGGGNMLGNDAGDGRAPAGRNTEIVVGQGAKPNEIEFPGPRKKLAEKTANLKQKASTVGPSFLR